MLPLYHTSHNTLDTGSSFTPLITKRYSIDPTPLPLFALLCTLSFAHCTPRSQSRESRCPIPRPCVSAVRALRAPKCSSVPLPPKPMFVHTSRSRASSRAACVHSTVPTWLPVPWSRRPSPCLPKGNTEVLTEVPVSCQSDHDHDHDHDARENIPELPECLCRFAAGGAAVGDNAAGDRAVL